METAGAALAATDDALETLIGEFLRWKPIAPRRPRELARVSARLCRVLRDEVKELLDAGNVGLLDLAQDWRTLLYRGSFGGRAFPLWLDSAGEVPNVVPELLDHVAIAYERAVDGDDFFAYIAAVTDHSGYVERYRADLQTPGLRVHSLAEIGERHALRVAVVSLADRLCFGLCADPAIVDDLGEMAAGVEAEAEALMEAA